MVVREVLPRGAPAAVVLAHRAPLPGGQIGAPPLPARGALSVGVQPILLRIAAHDATACPMDVLREPAREVPISGRPDVLVLGGGAAGIAAAVAAARRGATTWLVEGSSAIGGLATVGLINLLLTLDDGDGHQVV